MNKLHTINPVYLWLSSQVTTSLDLFEIVRRKDLQTLQLRVPRKKEEEEEESPTKKSRCDKGQPKETSRHESKEQETLETRRLGEMFPTTEVLKRDKNSKIYVPYN